MSLGEQEEHLKNAYGVCLWSQIFTNEPAIPQSLFDSLYTRNCLLCTLRRTISHLSIGILTICKNEADVIVEWIEHHAFEGVNIVYIVDDNSTDNVHKTLEPYRRQGIVDIFSWVLTEPSRSPQEVRLNQILRQKPLFVHWLAMIDVDEYLWAPYNLRISDVLSDLPSKAGQVLLPWVNYGSNGHVEQPPQVVPAFIRRGVTHCRGKMLTKALIKPEAVEVATVHAHHLKPGFHIFAPDMKTVLGCPGNAPLDLSSFTGPGLLRLHHYNLMSYDRFMRVKATRGDVNGLNVQRDQTYFGRYDRVSSADNDDSLFRKVAACHHRPSCSGRHIFVNNSRDEKMDEFLFHSNLQHAANSTQLRGDVNIASHQFWNLAFNNFNSARVIFYHDVIDKAAVNRCHEALCDGFTFCDPWMFFRPCFFFVGFYNVFSGCRYSIFTFSNMEGGDAKNRAGETQVGVNTTHDIALM